MMENTKVVSLALPLYLKGTTDKAVLIIHGFTGYAGEFYELAGKLNDEGYTVSIPRLPGHGTNRRDFLKTGWKDWLEHVQNTYLDLRTQFESVSIVGLSMGGVLSLILASRFQPERIALLAPAIVVSNRIFYLTPLLKFFIKQMGKEWTPEEGDTDDIIKLGREYWSFNYPGQLASLYKLIRIARKGLSRIECPSLLMLSEKDRSVPLSAGTLIERGLKNSKLEKIILKNSPHVLVSGCEKEFVNDQVISWLNNEKIIPYNSPA